MNGTTRRPARSFPLRTLLLWLVVVLVVPMLVLVTVAVKRVMADARETAERRLIQEARGLIRLVEAELAGSIHTLTALALSPSLITADLDAFGREAARHLPAHPSWQTVLLARPDGSSAIAIDAAGSSRDGFRERADREEVERVLNTRAPVIGALRRGADASLGIAVHVPVMRDGEFRYVLSAVATPERLASAMSFLADEPWLHVVLDAEHVIVVRSRAAGRFVGSPVTDDFAAAIRGHDELTFQSVTLDGEEVYSGVTRGTLSGWLAVVAAPTAFIDADFRRTMTLLGSVGALLLGLGVVISLVIARRIARDMSMVTEAAAALVAGRPLQVFPPRVAEARQMSEALTRSAELLRSREDERDARVRQADAARAEAEAARQEAEAAMRAKDEFLAMLGHELRNPLAPVLNALHVADVSGGVLSDRERRVVERQVRHMARLVDDLLDMARLHREPVDLHVEHCDLKGIVSAAVEMTRMLYEAQAQVLMVEVPDSLSFECDTDRITQVLVNLLANASKYTAPGGRVHLKAWIEADEVVIQCEDNGIGLTSDLLSRVFDPFMQGPRGIDRRQGGLGLGLAVARGLVEQHGGRITAASEGEGRGSRFEVRLPLRSRVPMRLATPPLQAPGRAQVRVLVVEDNVDVRDMLVLALSMSGADTRGAGSSREALAVADEWHPEVAVLDIGLPDMDGYELARELRERAGGRPLSLIALTGYGGDTSAAEARAAGFDKFFVKPVGIDALLDAIARLRAPLPDDAPPGVQ